MPTRVFRSRVFSSPGAKREAQWTFLDDLNVSSQRELAHTRARARARISTPHVNTGRKREKKGEESTKVHASPPSLYRCCYVTGLRRLELTTIPPPLSRRGSVNSTKLTRRSPVFATSRHTPDTIRKSPREIYTGIGFGSKRGQSSSSSSSPYFARNIFVFASGNWMMMMMMCGVDRIDRRISASKEG